MFQIKICIYSLMNVNFFVVMFVMFIFFSPILSFLSLFKIEETSFTAASGKHRPYITAKPVLQIVKK